jgi:hypothetical protein
MDEEGDYFFAYTGFEEEIARQVYLSKKEDVRPGESLRLECMFELHALQEVSKYPCGAEEKNDIEARWGDGQSAIKDLYLNGKVETTGEARLPALQGDAKEETPQNL